MAGKFGWLTPGLAVALVCGGLGGSVFTWWIHREPPPRVFYSITTTGTGSDPAANSVVPNLSVRIGDKSVPAIYTHVVTLTRNSGYIDTVNIAVQIPHSNEIFGTSATAPSPVHNIQCTNLSDGLKCNMGPIDGRGEYKIVIASSSKELPVLSVAGKNISVVTSQDLANEETAWTNPLNLSFVVVSVLSLFLFVSHIANDVIRMRKLERQVRRDKTQS